MFKIAWNELYAHPLPENHRFPMEKYELLPQQLLHEGLITRENFFGPTPVTRDQILSTHRSDYWEKLDSLALSRKEERRTGFPLSRQLVDREVMIMGGTLECCHYALEYGVSMNIAGGTHHAFTDKGEGFCLLNDMAIAANHLLEEKQAKKILVVDLDVHQGNGTAEIFANEDRVFTFSMHGARNYPMQKEVSDLDIGLEDGTGDKEYLETLEDKLPELMSKVQPDFIFFQCGVDVLETDKLGRMSMTLQGCAERDRLVLETAHRAGVPLVASMGGGYSPRIADIVEAHANTFRIANELYF
jgi:acetoin utilization deacetylase AcuC-like enzyme